MARFYQIRDKSFKPHSIVIMSSANGAQLEAMVNAALSGHDLTPFTPAEDADGRPHGYQAECRRCGQTVWVGENGLMYSLLDDECPGGAS